MPTSDITVSIHRLTNNQCMIAVNNLPEGGDVTRETGPLYTHVVREMRGGRTSKVTFDPDQIHEPFKFIGELIQSYLPLGHLSAQDRTLLGVKILRNIMPEAF